VTDFFVWKSNVPFSHSEQGCPQYGPWVEFCATKLSFHIKVKVKMFMCLHKQHAMKMYGDVEKTYCSRSDFYSSRHQIACFKATEGLKPPPPRTVLRQQYSVASFATLRVLSCLHSPGLRCSWYNVVRFCCDFEACSMVMAPTVLDSHVVGAHR
jgi:hypothetical protein